MSCGLRQLASKALHGFSFATWLWRRCAKADIHLHRHSLSFLVALLLACLSPVLMKYSHSHLLSFLHVLFTPRAMTLPILISEIRKSEGIARRTVFQVARHTEMLLNIWLMPKKVFLIFSSFYNSSPTSHMLHIQSLNKAIWWSGKVIFERKKKLDPERVKGIWRARVE